MKDMDHIVDIVSQTGFETYVYFKNGFLENVYENTLLNRLRDKGLEVKQQHALAVKASQIQHGIFMNSGSEKSQVKI